MTVHTSSKKTTHGINTESATDPGESNEQRRIFRKIKFLRVNILVFMSVQLLLYNFADSRQLALLVDDRTHDYLASLIGDLTLLFCSPYVGALIDRSGLKSAINVSTGIVCLSIALFVFPSWLPIVMWQVLHHFAFAIVKISIFSFIADSYAAQAARCLGFALVLTFTSFGYFADAAYLTETLVALSPYLLYAVLVVNGVLLFGLLRELKRQEELVVRVSREGENSIVLLFLDPCMAGYGGVFFISNVPLAFMQRSGTLWLMNDEMTFARTSTVWYMFLSYVVGAVMVAALASKWSNLSKISMSASFALMSCSYLAIAFARLNAVTLVSSCAIAFAIGCIHDTVLPGFARLAEARHSAVYGKVYAVPNVFCALAYVAATLLPLCDYKTLDAWAILAFIVLVVLILATFVAVKVVSVVIRTAVMIDPAQHV